MAADVSSTGRQRFQKFARSALSWLIAAALGAGAACLAVWWLAPVPEASTRSQGSQEEHAAESHESGDEHDEHREEGAGTIRFPAHQQIAAGIRIEPARRGDLTTAVRVTGKLALNQDRVTHIHPLVEGRVHEVRVQFGDRVLVIG
ncbi:MAG: efflux RND transporter periplasmic adaptor subunit [Planctomycetes bacterium]|nr:efflux RND transporter periplasmic adaptor subunit [Planctomycetota bacterium]